MSIAIGDQFVEPQSAARDLRERVPGQRLLRATEHGPLVRTSENISFHPALIVATVAGCSTLLGVSIAELINVIIGIATGTFERLP